MKVSVIIPVYNAAPFLHECVDSCVYLDAVEEVILIEDGSSDNSYELCEEIASRHGKVQVVRHSDGENKGPGLSRNLGLELAKSDLISFLDADDYYLPNRFDHCLPIFEYTSVDGTYEVIGATYSDDGMKERHLERMSQNKRNIVNPILEMSYTGVEAKVKPQDLMYHLLKSDLGWIHLNALTIRRASLDGFDGFNENYLGQDGEFIARLSAERKLVSTGNFEPVAVRRVHQDNRILEKRPKQVNRIQIDRSYWYEYLVKHRRFDKTLIYIVLRMTEDLGLVSRLFKIVKLLLKAFISVSLK